VKGHLALLACLAACAIPAAGEGPSAKEGPPEPKLVEDASSLSHDKAFEDANRLYRKGAGAEAGAREALYREAARRYAELARRVPNGYVLYNLGNARFRAGELGRAIAAYRRAEVYLPRHGPTKRNLALARVRAPGGSPGRGPHPAAAAFFFWHYAMSLAEVETLAAVAFLALVGVLSVRLFAGSGLVRRRLRTAAIILGAVVLVLALSAAAKLARRSSPGAVVVAPRARVRSEPAPRAVELFSFEEGAEVRVLGRSGGWTRVELESDPERRGWVETRAVELLSEPPHAGTGGAALPRRGYAGRRPS
jgi:hypothetical protein